MQTSDSTVKVKNQLRALLREALLLRNQGAPYARIARAHGYADGYMRLLLDSGVMDSRALLSLVTEVRREVDGPATTVVELEPSASLAHA
ncbi:MAG TPA: hypothetical protein VGP93_16845 [Polyangiaceae bacterium]|jgi:hypothetical protein|nr:hypothetical protein [Polyangiaceae bacterium]